MKLYYDRKSNDPTYFVQQGIRNGKKTTTKNIFRIGKHSELIEQGHDNPLEYAKKIVAEYNDKIKEETLDIQFVVDFTKKLLASDKKESDSTLLNIGYLPLQAIYQKLKLSDFFKRISAERKFEFDPNTINRFLTFDRILFPQSKLSTIKNLHMYYEKPEFSHQQALRFMDLLAENYDEYLKHLYTNSLNIFKRDTSVCYYDCTNYYFEIETQDYDYVDPDTGEIIPGFRKYGPSKEHRPNPLVQMGLFMDKNGIPIHMCLTPGNRNEQTTVKGLESKLIKMLDNKKIIYCADAGLGSSSIRLLNGIQGRAFIVTQSIKKLSDDIKTQVFKDEYYKLLSNDTAYSIKKMKTLDYYDETNKKLVNDVVYKSINADSMMDLGLTEKKICKNGNVKKVKSKGKLEQRIIVTFSRKMMEYQRNIRNAQIERAKNLIDTKDPEEIKKGPNDVRRFLKRTNKKEDEKDQYIIDQSVIDEEEKYDGYYAIATNLMDESAKGIFEVNDKRYKIEECFRVLKTNFEARPVYHHLENRITSHFLICFTALLIYRLLENLLIEKGYKLTIDQILNTLRKMQVTNIEDLFLTSTYTSSECVTAINELFNLGLDKKNYRIKDMNKKVKEILK